jgi:hypothetical protein
VPLMVMRLALLALLHLEELIKAAQVEAVL